MTIYEKETKLESNLLIVVYYLAIVCLACFARKVNQTKLT